MRKRIEFLDLLLRYKEEIILNNINLELDEGHIGALVGPSGCGKTSLLKVIAGFEHVNNGFISIHGTKVTYPGYTLSPEKRHVGMVFQDYALFPNMSVRSNICFGIEDLTQEQKDSRADQMLDLIGLRDVQHAYPYELSGGEQQRVALARAMAPEPEILLLDEPFSSVDAELRESLALDVRSILKELNVTSILVTHDQNEAFMVADDIGVMNNGHIEQWANAYNIYHKPETRFVADFVGLGVFVKGISEGGNIKTPVGIFKLPKSIKAGSQKEVELLIRPDDVIHNDFSKLSAIVEEKHFRGAEFLYKLKCHGVPLLCYAPSHHDHKIGEPIGIDIDLEHLVIFQN